MLCESIRNWFNDYLDGDLKQQRKRMVDKHLARCSRCREEFDKLQHADDRLRQEIKFIFGEIPVPEGLSQRISERVDRTAYRAPFFQRLRPLGRYAGIAAALIVFVAAYGLYQQYFSVLPIKDPVTDQPSRVIVENANPAGNYDGLPEGAMTPSTESAGQPTEDMAQQKDLMLADSAQPANQASPSMAGAQNSAASALQRGTEQSAGGSTVDLDRVLPTDDGRSGSTKKVTTGGGNSSGSSSILAAPLSAKASQSSRETLPTSNAYAPDSKEQQDLAATGSTGATLLPRYLPAGAKLVKTDNLGGTTRLNYTAGQGNFYIEESPAPGNQVSAYGAANIKSIRINNQSGLLQNPSPSGGISLTWEQDGLNIKVHGNLPEPELLKIAESL